ncbi:PP2C family protein-serine/threonine phosphatase [Streptomyces xantholiticus]
MTRSPRWATRCRRLHGASAGHLPPLVVTPDHQARYPATDSGLPLGVDPGLPRRDQSEILPTGSTLLMHTDGLVEHRDRSIDEGMAATADIARRPRHRTAARALRRAPHPRPRRFPRRRRPSRGAPRRLTSVRASLSH